MKFLADLTYEVYLLYLEVSLREPNDFDRVKCKALEAQLMSLLDPAIWVILRARFREARGIHEDLAGEVRLLLLQIIRDRGIRATSSVPAFRAYVERIIFTKALRLLQTRRYSRQEYDHWIGAEVPNLTDPHMLVERALLQAQLELRAREAFRARVRFRGKERALCFRLLDLAERGEEPLDYLLLSEYQVTLEHLDFFRSYVALLYRATCYDIREVELNASRDPRPTSEGEPGHPHSSSPPSGSSYSPTRALRGLRQRGFDPVLGPLRRYEDRGANLRGTHPSRTRRDDLRGSEEVQQPAAHPARVSS